jgi:predicted TIM-barrel fold metal-dependent hydrolase
MNSSRRQFMIAMGMASAWAEAWAPESKGSPAFQQQDAGLPAPPLPPEATQGPWRNLLAVREKKVIDIHNHTYETATMSPTMRGTGLLHKEGHYVNYSDDLIASMDRHGVAKCILSPAFVVPAYETFYETSYKKYPKRFEMFASVTARKPAPSIPEAAKLIREQLSKGARGVGESGLPNYDSPGDLKPVMDVLMEFDVPVMIPVSWSATASTGVAAGGSPYQAGWRAAERLGAVAAYYPDVKVIMAHTGGRFDFLDGYEALRVAFSFDNVWCETSKSTARIITEAVKGLGAEKVLFGSDWNRPQLKTYGPKHYRDIYQHWYNLNQVALADITEDERDMILYKNAMRMLKLGS